MLMNKTRAHKAQYRVRNWPEYNSALARRADLTLWISDDVVKNWRGSGRYRYSNQAIDAVLMLRAVYHLPLRQTTGLVRSIFRILALDHPVPDFSTLSRRSRYCPPRPSEASGRHRTLVIDSSGFRLHGSSHSMKREDKRRSRSGWRKLHILVDAETAEIVADELTVADVHDVEVAPNLLERVMDPIARLYGDGAYNSNPLRAHLSRRTQPPPMAEGIFPPGKSELMSKNKLDLLSSRGRHIDLIRRKGWRAWRRINDVGKRELVEMAFARLKRIFGFRLRSRSEAALKAEARRMVMALNIMTKLGMPDTVKL